jgi:A/G-specific adenine glycosylase
MSKPSAAKLLIWYDTHARVLPWRAPPGTHAMDPYKVWLSEIMLQQTTVAAVTPYFGKFLALWPTIDALAAAPVEDVLKEWAGLGYYARARNLHKCAQAIAILGSFPGNEAELLKLPGIGPYTAAAITSIAFGMRAIVVDGNVERVITRLFRVEQRMPAAKPAIHKLASALTPDKRSGDYAQAMMDLGATVCTPTSPKCSQCPWRSACGAYAAGDPERFPVKLPKVVKPVRYGIAYVVEQGGSVLLFRRPDKGLLGGMVAFPTTDWTTKPVLPSPPLEADWLAWPETVIHIFTHFRLELTVHRTRLKRRVNIENGFWQPVGDIERAGLPTVFAKVAKLINSPMPRLL